MESRGALVDVETSYWHQVSSTASRRLPRHTAAMTDTAISEATVVNDAEEQQCRTSTDIHRAPAMDVLQENTT